MPATRTGRCMTAALLAALAVAAPAAAKTRYKTLATEADFEALAAELLPAAVRYAEADNDAAPPAHDAVKDVEYAPKSAEHLAKALLKGHKDPLARLYVAWQLLRPLERVGDKHLAKLRAPLLQLFGLCRYREMPNWPPHKLAKLTIPKRRMPRLERQRREADRRKLLAEKTAADRAVVKFNRLAAAMQKDLKLLLVRMGQRQADEVLIARLGEEESGDWNTYATTLECIRAEAVRMPGEQAKRYYEALRRLMKRSNEKRTYRDPTRPQYSSEQNSSFAAQPRWFAHEVAKVINLLATSAREPAVIVPQDKKHRRRR